ncbi:Piso0_003479 [Millerozyma farinosa CBS 7064]|uniref:Kinesin-like protein n=1 Tax=Pichia sorbitophila (strain ATCC MYA-4447 / BCRC 22081 / CBS 7064 / NBRC 10061 / NRRL Y-12695) TaxID=559304 RepID=G8YJ68_PICSO|nr:Piso0_003479 [Millerozyma farinosa CBS 7064]CCE81128.1 Piso0_003479 [Millerozyma farinosa CBS 7064]
MSSVRTPLKSRASLMNISISNEKTPSVGSAKSRSGFTELRRPSTSRMHRSTTPRGSNNGRPSSAAERTQGSGSRPSTPSFLRRQEPYTGSITVSIRPNPYSYNPAHGASWEIDDQNNTITNVTDAALLNFDNVFAPDPRLTNREVYQRACYNTVEQCIHEGFNGTIFAYGMTGSGKTFSMRGDQKDPGIVKLAIDDIFQFIDSSKPSKQVSLTLSYIEIYNERIVDLLHSDSNAAELRIRDDPVYGTRVTGVLSPTIHSKEEMMQYIRQGDNIRKTRATDFNSRSSRSHSILQIRINTIDIEQNTEQNSTLSLCDLAGSEKATSSVERRKEGAYINKSLLALSNVINKLSLASNLASPSGNTEHIPYRDSKLTRLLQPALSGSSLISIVCTIHLGSFNMTNANQSCIPETYNTLRFAARAKDIVISVKRNKKVSLGDNEITKVMEDMKKLIESQKREIISLRSGSDHSDPEMTASVDELRARIASLSAENRLLYEKLEHLTRLNDLQRTETIMLRNDSINDILGSGLDSKASQIMIANLEDFYKRVNHELEEHKAYISRLEDQLRNDHRGMLLRADDQKENQRKVSDYSIEAVLKDQEEEILHLKELLNDKDHIIKNLTRTTKLRKLIDDNSLSWDPSVKLNEPKNIL